ncbi:MAG: GIY-YIG nuclease family protein, partial [Bacteroidota bacterium]
MDGLPDETGVYYFHGANGEILYVGKSTSVRKRILSHFQGAHKTNRATRMVQRIHDVSYTLTGSELVALLLENEEIKRLLPPFNRAQRRRNFKVAVYAEEDEQGYINFFTGEYDEEKRPLAGFSSQGQAERALELRGRQFQLCLKKYGVEKGTGRCFHHQLHICQGACIEE